MSHKHLTRPVRHERGFLQYLLAILLLVSVAAVSLGVYIAATKASNIVDLIKTNERLRKQLAQVLQDTNIGYAKVLTQETYNGDLYTTIVFAPQPNDPNEPVVGQKFNLRGDVVHVDGVVIRFSDDLIKSGEEEAIFLWRRVYDEYTQPSEGQTIDRAGAIPERFSDLVPSRSWPLFQNDEKIFWRDLWNIAENLTTYQKDGIVGLTGNVLYQRIRPGVIYNYKINTRGQVTTEETPDPIAR